MGVESDVSFYSNDGVSCFVFSFTRWYSFSLVYILCRLFLDDGKVNYLGILYLMF